MTVSRHAPFYLDTVILADPLFAMTRAEHESHSVWSKALGMPAPQRLNRKALIDAATMMLHCRPLVAQGYVRFFPTSLETEAPAQLPIYMSDNGFESVLPPRLLSLYKQAADVRSLVPSSMGMTIQPELKLDRRIYIEFDRDSGTGFFYHLAEQKVNRPGYRGGPLV